MLAQSDLDREIYEGRLKARRDERAKMSGALEQGMQQGVEKGLLVGRIQMCQELLGVEGASRAELETLDIENLQRIADELRGQFSR